MKTNNIITLAPLNTWQHFRNLELQHQKGSTTLLFSLHFMKQVAGTRKRATLLKWLAVQKVILKSHSSKLLFCKIHTHLQVSSRCPACLLGFSSLGLHRTGYVCGGKEGHVQLRQLFIAVPFRQSTRTQINLRGALMALNQSKGLRRGIQCEESFQLLCTRTWQLGKCDTRGGRWSTLGKSGRKEKAALARQLTPQSPSPNPITQRNDG